MKDIEGLLKEFSLLTILYSACVTWTAAAIQLHPTHCYNEVLLDIPFCKNSFVYNDRNEIHYLCVTFLVFLISTAHRQLVILCICSNCQYFLQSTWDKWQMYLKQMYPKLQSLTTTCNADATVNRRKSVQNKESHMNIWNGIKQYYCKHQVVTCIKYLLATYYIYLLYLDYFCCYSSWCYMLLSLFV